MSMMYTDTDELEYRGGKKGTKRRGPKHGGTKGRPRPRGVTQPTKQMGPYPDARYNEVEDSKPVKPAVSITEEPDRSAHVTVDGYEFEFRWDYCGCIHTDATAGALKVIASWENGVLTTPKTRVPDALHNAFTWALKKYLDTPNGQRCVEQTCEAIAKRHERAEEDRDHARYRLAAKHQRERRKERSAWEDLVRFAAGMP